MNQSTCFLVAVATKSLRARWKSSDWHETKTPAHWPRKVKHKTVCRIEVHQRSAAEKQNDYLTRGRIMLWILICALSLWYHLSSQKSKGIRFFNESNGVSIMHRRSVYVVMSTCASLYCSHAKQIREDLWWAWIASKSHFANWQPQNSSPMRQGALPQQDRETAKNDKSVFGSDALD